MKWTEYLALTEGMENEFRGRKTWKEDKLEDLDLDGEDTTKMELKRNKMG
jgi:hypothetical protein